jgi:hypothetical protein
MRYGYVATNLLDLWAEPRFNAERSSQLLFAELLTVHDEQQGHFLVKQIDGYSGWVDSRQIVLINENAYDAYHSARLSAIKSSRTPIFHKQHLSAAPHHILYGSQVRVVRQSKGLSEILLPDGQQRLVRAGSLAATTGKGASSITGTKLVSEAKRFLGVPYLWGGASPCGFDCSGLVQTICRRFGMAVPRDTKDQISIGAPVPREEVRTGDLLFFKRHVGFAIGRDRIIHCSIGGSGVRINSLRPRLPDYREDLDRDFNQARRLV